MNEGNLNGSSSAKEQEVYSGIMANSNVKKIRIALATKTQNMLS